MHNPFASRLLISLTAQDVAELVRRRSTNKVFNRCRERHAIALSLLDERD